MIADVVFLDPLDDFDRPLASPFECSLEFVTGVAGIGEDMAQPGKGIADGGEEQRRSIAILDASLMQTFLPVPSPARISVPSSLLQWLRWARNPPFLNPPVLSH